MLIMHEQYKTIHTKAVPQSKNGDVSTTLLLDVKSPVSVPHDLCCSLALSALHWYSKVVV